VQPIGVDIRGSRILVVDSGNARVQEFDTDGTYLGQFGSGCIMPIGSGCTDPDGPGGPLETGDGQFNGPRGLAIDRLGQIFVVDGANDRIQKFRDPLVIGAPGDGVRGGFRFLAAPNPFGSSVGLTLDLPDAPAGASEAVVTARILDVAGREVRRLWEGMLPAGEHQFAWDGRNDAGVSTPTGLYFAVVELDGRRAAAVKLVRTP
jgi:hypothetical protein